MDYADAYSAQAGDYGMPDMSNGDPNAGAPGYHYDETQGMWVPNQVDPTKNPTRGGEQRPEEPAPTDPPPPPPPPSGGGALAPFAEAAPQLAQQPAFSFDQFKTPTMEEALNDPGYQFRVQQGRDSLQNWAAARNTLNDSDTGKMLIDYGQNAAEQGYGSVYARDFGAWQGTEQAAERSYGMNRQSQYIDPWTAAYNAWVQRGNWYNQNQGTVAQTALGFASL